MQRDRALDILLLAFKESQIAVSAGVALDHGGELAVRVGATGVDERQITDPRDLHYCSADDPCLAHIVSRLGSLYPGVDLRAKSHQ